MRMSPQAHVCSLRGGRREGGLPVASAPPLPIIGEQMARRGEAQVPTRDGSHGVRSPPPAGL